MKTWLTVTPFGLCKCDMHFLFGTKQAILGENKLLASCVSILLNWCKGCHGWVVQPNSLRKQAALRKQLCFRTLFCFPTSTGDMDCLCLYCARVGVRGRLAGGTRLYPSLPHGILQEKGCLRDTQGTNRQRMPLRKQKPELPLYFPKSLHILPSTNKL